MTTDLCSSFETDMLWPLLPRPSPAQAHKCLKNTCLSAGASVKTFLFTHLTKPGSRKEKQREKPYSLSSNSLKTHGRHKEKTTEMADGPRSFLFMLPDIFLSYLACNEAALSSSFYRERRTRGGDRLSDTGVRPTTPCARLKLCCDSACLHYAPLCTTI